ncbi:transcriptional regulator [Brevibacillus gelatini]|uniref:Transcriptional regulator n=2 Tax=Brevibacillus TaxID=55080 RepID=A0A3M8B3A3_9BACL|nr:transcriptional regulator [Brevibacillus gelatini]
MLLVELAAATGLSVRSLRLAEQNKLTVSPPNLRKLSEALGMSIAYLGCFENLPEHTLGQRIKKARLYHGYNKREFGKKLGVSTRMILWWEKDVYRPSEKYMERLDKFLAIFPSL